MKNKERKIIILYTDGTYETKFEKDLQYGDLLDDTFLLLFPYDNKSDVYIPIKPRRFLWFTRAYFIIGLISVEMDYTEDNATSPGEIVFRNRYNTISAFVNGIQIMNNINGLYAFYNDTISHGASVIFSLCINHAKIELFYDNDNIYEADTKDNHMMIKTKTIDYWDFVYANMDRLETFEDIIVRSCDIENMRDIILDDNTNTWWGETDPNIRSKYKYVLRYSDLFSIFIKASEYEVSIFNNYALNIEMIEYVVDEAIREKFLSTIHVMYNICNENDESYIYENIDTISDLCFTATNNTYDLLGIANMIDIMMSYMKLYTDPNITTPNKTDILLKVYTMDSECDGPTEEIDLYITENKILNDPKYLYRIIQGEM